MAAPWILISILVIIIILGIAVFFVNRKNKIKTDYYSLFWMGLFWFIIGLPLDNVMLYMLGVVFMITGLVNKSKWKKNQLKWDKLSRSEQRMRTIMITIIALVLFILILMLVFFKKGFV